MSRSFLAIGITPTELRRLAEGGGESGGFAPELPDDPRTLRRLADEMDELVQEAEALGISTEPYELVALYEDDYWSAAVEDKDGEVYEEFAEVAT